MEQNRGVEVAAARAHHGAFERRKAHGCVDGFSVLDRGHTHTVANVAGDEVLVWQAFGAEPTDGLLGNVFVAGAVKAVTPNRVFFVEGVREWVEVGVFRQRGVEGGVEDRDVFGLGQQFLASADAFEIWGVVERGERVEFGQVSEDTGGDEGGLLVLFAAVHDAVADFFNFVWMVEVALLGQRFESDAQSIGVPAHTRVW